MGEEIFAFPKAVSERTLALKAWNEDVFVDKING